MYIFDVEIIKYGLVGFTGLIIDFSITWFCKEKLFWNKYLSNSLGFSFALINNYFLNKHWTFQNNTSSIQFPFLFFSLIAISGLAINNLFIYFVSQKKKSNFYIIKFIAIVVVFIWNYLLNSTFTFK